MEPVTIICGTVLIVVFATLWFASKHITNVNQWKSDLNKHIQDNLSLARADLRAQVAEESHTLQDLAKVAAERAEKFYKDLEVVNQNQINLSNELVVIKNTQNLRGGMLRNLQQVNHE